MIDLPWLKNPGTVPGANGSPQQVTSTNNFSIEQFKAMLSKSNGLAPTNRYFVVIRPPKSMLGVASTDYIQLLAFRCQAADLPGRGLSTVDVRRQNPGVVQRIPYGQINSDTTLTFMCGADMKEFKFFNKWVNSIVRVPASNENGFQTSNPNALPYETEYFDEVKSEIEIHVYDYNNNDIYACVMREAVPTFISPIPLSWQNENQYMQFQVTFAYKDWIDSNAVQTKLFDPPLRISKTLSKNVTAQPLNTMLSEVNQLPTHVYDALNVINNSGSLFNVLNNI